MKQGGFDVRDDFMGDVKERRSGGARWSEATGSLLPKKESRPKKEVRREGRPHSRGGDFVPAPRQQELRTDEVAGFRASEWRRH